MADTKISALAAASAAAAANELAINEAGTTKKLTAAQLKTFANTAPAFTAGTASANTHPKLSAGTLLTAAEAGALEYDGVSFYNTVDATSGRGHNAVQQYFRLSADLTAIGPTIADFFGANSAFPTVGSAVYEFLFFVMFTKTTAGTVTFTLTNTQAWGNVNLMADLTGVAGFSLQSGPITAVRGTTAAMALPASGSLTTAVDHLAIIRALGEIGTAGNVRLRVTSSAGTVTPRRGSYYLVRRLPAANVGTFVA